MVYRDLRRDKEILRYVQNDRLERLCSSPAVKGVGHGPTPADQAPCGDSRRSSLPVGFHLAPWSLCSQSGPMGSTVVHAPPESRGHQPAKLQPLTLKHSRRIFAGGSLMDVVTLTCGTPDAQGYSRRPPGGRARSGSAVIVRRTRERLCGTPPWWSRVRERCSGNVWEPRNARAQPEER